MVYIRGLYVEICVYLVVCTIGEQAEAGVWATMSDKRRRNTGKLQSLNSMRNDCFVVGFPWPVVYCSGEGCELYISLLMRCNETSSQYAERHVNSL